MDSAPEGEQGADRVLDRRSLKALAHPLRVKLIDQLWAYGPATASGLAARLGESSGATSYHLRQLERHAFVREVPGKGTNRERWWERVPGGVTIGAPSPESTPAEKLASRLVLQELINGRSQHLQDFIDRGDTELADEWLTASMLSAARIELTSAQADELSLRLRATLDEFITAHSDHDSPGSRAVVVQLNVFPILSSIPLGTEGTA
ncbi:winged helix-turn-helix domain-containing protein [Planctomonas psychrotolerans]|uniref:winged helix-turn-helix domain-containing protein n=1 Tax=Planctomonas psychrotolerans TaxID=2528712 RepID=UPI001D0CF969|nr:helix-turn-helix domain-containing protein [Planctomonas psychrotolerans]